MTLPLDTQTRLAHAVLQHLASSRGVDLLHIKGAAIDSSIAGPGRSGSDADVLVRPSHLPRLLAAMETHGWQVHTRFETGSPFGHATTLVHPTWGYADVHRYFPGITAPPAQAFERLWVDRVHRPIAAIECPVPGLAAQRTILVLNAARGGFHAPQDLAAAWGSTSEAERREVLMLVSDLDAHVAFAAATGDLDRFRGERQYDLWRIMSQGGSRTAEWMARIKAAPTAREALRLALIAPIVNTDHLTVILGRPPSPSEIAREFVRRLRKGAGEIATSLGARLLRRRGR